MRHFKTPLARQFVRASSLDLSHNGAVVTAEPLSMFCWFYSTSLTVDQGLMSLGNDGSFGFWAIQALGGVGGDPIAAQKQNDASGTARADSSTGYAANRWQSALAVFTDSTSRTIYLNGGASATNTTSVADPSADFTSIGSIKRGSTANYLSGGLLWPAFWNIALTAIDAAALASGAHPLTVRPESLVAFWDWDGRGTEFGLRATYPLTNNGTTPVNGPDFLRQEIRKPRRRFNSVGGAPPATNRLLNLRRRACA